MNTTSALAVACALVLVGCDRSRNPDSSLDTAAGAAPSASRLTSAPATQARAADLGKPIDEYTGAEFYSHVRGLQYAGGTDRDRRCRGCTGVDADARTRVRVDGIAGVDSISAGNVPQFGVIVSRALNRGTRQEDRYGFRAGARYEYYLIVLPGAAGASSSRWRIEELEIVGTSYARRQLAVGPVEECGHRFVRGARADFRGCNDEPAATPASFSALRQEGGDDDPWWYGCGSGCCIAERGGEG